MISDFGPYRVLGKLGEGGMGEVYRAHDSRLDRDVAIKVLPHSFADDQERRARFEREAKAIAALSHPNILAIHDIGEVQTPEGVSRPGHSMLYVVTELLEGETLRDHVNRGALPVRKAIDAAMQIARGLTAAHDRGIVHRDLKPENVFLLADGRVKILDFGLAKGVAKDPAAADETATAAAMTDPGTIMGTVGYMAPEQIRGHAVDARTDLFALGALLYEMLSGQRAFRRETAAETMTAILREDPPELSVSRAELPPALERIVRLSREECSGAVSDGPRRCVRARGLFGHRDLIVQGGGRAAAATLAQSCDSRRGLRHRRRRGGIRTHDPAPTVAARRGRHV